MIALDTVSFSAEHTRKPSPRVKKKKGATSSTSSTSVTPSTVNARVAAADESATGGEDVGGASAGATAGTSSLVENEAGASGEEATSGGAVQAESSGPLGVADGTPPVASDHLAGKVGWVTLVKDGAPPPTRGRRIEIVL